MNPHDAHLILKLRLLIARAAGSDSLQWWDDGAFSEPARFILQRTFPVSPSLAARSLSLRSAWERHLAAMPDRTRPLHLFRLDDDGRDKLALRKYSLLDVPVVEEPIVTMEALREQLIAIMGDLPEFEIGQIGHTRALHIRPSARAYDENPMVHRARVFAAAYLEGEHGRAVFPYIAL